MSHLELPESLRVERDESVLVVRLCRASKRNALDDATMLGLESVFSSIPAGVGAAVLCAEGEHFSAGLDLSELTEHSAAEGALHSRQWHRVLDRLQFGRVPVVAALHGAVVGGGLELAAAAHIRVAERSTFYALPEGARGIFVGGGASVRVPRLIGVARMADMILTGRVVQAEEGHQIGLAQYLVGTGEGLAHATKLARRIAENAPMTNYAVMHALPRIAEVGQDQGLFLESLMAAISQDAPEAKQRLRDFLNKQARKVGEE
ncbi:MAG TPA: crotonase/enoyl-CoA hydratase family protein [Polyangiaceae bacterium]|jgi:enoyl-CoA hydratase/carnithine racemase